MPRAAAAKAAAKFAKMDDDAAFEAAMKADELAAQKRKAEAAARPKKKKKEPEVEVEYEIEAILDVKKASTGELVYLVKWKGWPAEDSTWEPKSALGSGGVAWEAESPGRENSFPSRKKADVRQHQTA